MGSADDRFKKVGAALQLIAAADPQRMRRISDDIDRIVLLESGPEFWPRGRVCVLPGVTSHPAIATALLIVHEGVHARLLAAGIPYTSGLRARIEALCVREELSFLQKLPTAPEVEDLIAYTRRKLELQWWLPGPAYERGQDTLKSAGAPRWLIRLHERFFRPKAD